VPGSTEGELFKLSVLNNNPDAAKNLKITLAEIDKNLTELQKKIRSGQITVDEAFRTVGKKNYKILNDFDILPGTVDSKGGIYHGKFRDLLIEKGVPEGHIVSFAAVTRPILTIRDIVKSLSNESQRKLWGLNVDQAKSVQKGWKNVFKGYAQADTWIKGVERVIGDKKFREVFGDVNFDHTLAKSFGKDYKYLPRDYLLRGKYTTDAFNQTKNILYDRPMIKLVKEYEKAGSAQKKIIQEKINTLHNKFNASFDDYVKDFQPTFKDGKFEWRYSEPSPFAKQTIHKYASPALAQEELAKATVGFKKAATFEGTAGQTKVIERFQAKQKEFNNLLSNNIDNLDDATKNILAKANNCPIGASSGGRIGFSPGGVVDCLKKKLKRDPKLFLQNMGQTAIKTKNANILNLLRTGKNIARGTGIFAMWEAAFAPIVGALMVPGGESWDRIKHELAYGSILEAIGVSPDFVPGISEKEEKIEYYGQSGYDVSRMNEIATEFANLQAQRNAEINKYAGVDYYPQSMRYIEDKMKKLGGEYMQISGSFEEGPAGGAGRLGQGIQDWMKGDVALQAQKEENIEKYRKWKLLPEENWRENLPVYRSERSAGGRAGFKLGGIDKGRRAFMKWFAGITGATVAAGTGLIKWGKIAGKGKTAVKIGDTIIQDTAGMPSWFIPLVNRITKEGTDVTKKLSTIEREIVHSKKIKGHDVDVYQDMNTGNIRVEVQGGTGKNLTAYDEGLSLEYSAPIEDITSKGKPFKTKPDFQVSETEASYTRTGPDDADLLVESNIQGQPTKFDRKKGTWVVDETKATTDGILSDTNFLKNYAKKKKTTMKEIVETGKKKKEIKYLNKNPHEDPRIPEGPEADIYDDYLPDIDDLD